MSTNQIPSNNEELDISLILKKLNDWYHGFLIFMYSIVKFFLKSWIIITILVLLGVVLGYFKTNGTSPKETTLYVRVNGNAGGIVYDAVDQFMNQIKAKDTVALKAMGFYNNQVYFIHSAEIEPVVNVIEIVDETEVNNRNLEVVMDNAQFEDELLKSEVFVPQYKYHKIELISDHWSSLTTIDAFINYLNDNELLAASTKVIKESLKYRIERNFESVSYMDSIFKTYGKPANQLAKGIAKDIALVDVNITNIHMLFEQKQMLMQQNEKLQVQLSNHGETVTLVNKPLLSTRKSILDNKIITYPIQLILLFSLFSIARYFFLKAKRLSDEREAFNASSHQNN